MFVFSGFLFPEYTGDNLFEFLPPKTRRDILPTLGKRLFKIDICEGTIKLCVGPEECGSYNGSIVVINSEELIITTDPRMYLFSERIVQSVICDLGDTYGACSLPALSKNRESYTCTTPSCLKVIHLQCDKSNRGKSSKDRMCPGCYNLDPLTWKKFRTIQLNRR